MPPVSSPHRLHVLSLYALLLFQRVHVSPRFRESPLFCQRRVLHSLCLLAVLARAPVRTNPRAFPCYLALLQVVCVTADGDVSAKIAEELAYEKEAVIESEPEFLKEFKTSGIWTVHLFCFLCFF